MPNLVGGFRYVKKNTSCLSERFHQGIVITVTFKKLHTFL